MGSAGPVISSQAGGEQLKVRVVSEGNAWVKLPQSHANGLLSPADRVLPRYLRLIHTSSTTPLDTYVCWTGLTTQSANAIEIPTEIAKCANLQDGDTVKLELIPDPPVASTVYLKPASREDWEVIEPNDKLLCKDILKQMKVVRVGDLLPVCIRGQSVHMRIHGASPANIVRLENESILSVEPFSVELEDSAGEGHDLESPSAKTASPESEGVQGGDGAITSGSNAKQAVQNKARLEGPFRLRVQVWTEGATRSTLPLKDCDPSASAQLQTMSSLAVFVSPSFAEEAGIKHGASFAIQTKPEKQPKDALIPVCIDDDVPTGHLFMAKPLVRVLGLSPSSQVWLRRGDVRAASILKLKKLTVSLLKNYSVPSPEAEDAQPEPEQVAGPMDPVSNALNHGCSDLLAAAASTTSGTPLRLELANIKAGKTKQAKAFDPLNTPPGEAPTAEDVHQSLIDTPLRSLLSAWLKTQLDSIQQGSSEADSLAKLQCPSPMVMHLTSPGTEGTSYLIRFTDTPYSNTLLELAKVLERCDKNLVVEIAKPVEFPMVNPLMQFKSWCRDIFWQAPRHIVRDFVNRPMNEVIPSSKGWLDAEMQHILKIAMPYLSIPSQTFWKNTHVPPPGGILVSGMRGCGKTAVLERTAAYLASHPSTMCHVSRINCRAMAGDKAARIAKWFQYSLVTALMHAPAVVLLDDLDSLMPVIPEHAPPQEQHQMEFVTELFAEIFDWVRTKAEEAGAPVLLIASCTDASKLPKLLRTTGRLDHPIEVGTPNTAERASMLSFMLEIRGISCDHASLDTVARQTEGYDSTDLNVVIERAVQGMKLQTLLKQNSGRTTMELKHWTKALAEFQPAAAWEANADGAVDATIKGWQDVGGMAEAKEALYEAIELPLRFAKLVAKAPLRLRTGVLLYGPPGCGKTHAVRAAVAGAGVRFVSVKGPELLNKYIGASEEAVRSVFARAQAAAPCVLFFDEFDSIAPQRGAGSDSTGVTERVVNQLLTELDGVEKLQGVCVIAASNRPDLIDNALLRPGRLDRLIYCGFPTLEDRKSVFTAVSSKINLEADVDLGKLAEVTDGFSGADLRAIVSEAQLAAVHRHLEVLQAKQQESGVVDKSGQHTMPLVSQQDVDVAIAGSRPSLSAASRSELDVRYSKFMKAREGTKKPFSADAIQAKADMAALMSKMQVAMG